MEKDPVSQKLKEDLPEREKPKEKPALAKEAKEVILEKLEAKAGIIKRVKEITDNVGLDDSREKVEEKLYTYLKEVDAYFPDVPQKLQEIKALQNDLEGINDQISSFEKNSRMGELADEEEEKFFELEEDAEVLDITIRRLEKDDDVVFTDSLRNGIFSFLTKFTFIKTFAYDKEALKGTISKTLFPKEEKELKNDDVKDIIIEPFTIHIILEEECFRSIKHSSENLEGFHLPGTPFNIIKASNMQERVRSTIRHEKIHNFADGLVERLPYPSQTVSRELSQRVNNVKRLKEMGAPENVQQKQTLNVLRLFSSLTDRLHEEMLADLDRIESLATKGEGKYTKGFGTSANEIDKILSGLKDFEQKEADSRIKELLSQCRESVNANFTRAARLMKESLFCSHRLGNDLEVHALLALLKPSKFSHIKTYLGSRFGRESISGLNALHEFLSKNFLSSTALKGISLIKDRLTDADKEKLREEIEDFDSARSQDRGLDDIEKVREYCLRVAELASYLDMGENFSKELFENHCIGGFFYTKLSESITYDFKDLPRFLQSLNANERLIFDDSLETYFANGFAYNDLQDITEGKTEITQDGIKSLPLWEILKQLNLNGIAEKGLNDYEEFLIRLQWRK